MKTSIKITIVFWFFSFAIVAQHNHEGLEQLCHSKTFAVFVNDLDVAPDDFQHQPLLNLMDNEYQNFQTSIRSRLSEGIEITHEQFESEYETMLSSTRNQIVLLNELELPVPGFPTKLLNGPCVNMDFEDGDFNGWDLTRGNVDGSVPFSYVGEFSVGPSAYHQIFGAGVDPVTGIPTVNPLGGTFSARLGNGIGTGAIGARMSQTFLVDATNYLYTYSYAVVFESPNGHTLNELPYFTVRVFDELGNNVPCGEYSVIADATNAPNYLTTNFGGETILYQDWQTVFTNLSAYIGQNVTIEFTAGDCSLTGHFGYAYVDASCAMNQIIASNNIICTGDNAVLTAPAGAASYLWNTGETTQQITVTSGGNYSCTLTPFQGGGCEIVLDIDITENPTPTANFSSNTLVACVNEVIDFTDLSSIPLPGIITNYRWNFGDGISTPLSNGAIMAVPNTTGTYLAPSHTYISSGVFNVELYVESADGCSDNIIIPVTINALPIVVAGIDQTVCAGTAVTLSGAGAIGYIWDNGVVDGVPFIPSVGTVTYTVIGTDINGCQNSDQVEVTVNPLPNVNAGLDQMLCEGLMVTLNGAGAIGYVWDNGVVDGVPFLQAVGTVTYKVTGTDANGCENTDEVDVTINPLPIVNAGLDQTFCEGPAVILTGAGATNYIWDNGVVDGVPFVQAVGTVTYTVVGTDANGCQNTDEIDVTINPLPIVNAGLDQVFCEGPTVTLSGAGAVGYVWSNGAMNGVPFVQPVGTVTYTVIGTDANGCQNSDQVNVTINPNPIVNAGANQSICDGTWITLSATGAPNLVWDNGIINNVPFQQVVGMVNYTVIGTLPTGCFSTDEVAVTVLTNPVVTTQDLIICEGEPAILVGAGAVSYQWSDGVVNNQPFYPNQTGIYTVIGTGANGCTSQVQATVTVNPLPFVDFDVLNLHLTTVNSTTGFDNLSSGAVNYEWYFSDGSPINTQFEPIHTFPEDQAGEYYIELTGYSEFGCSARAIKYVHVFREYLIYVPNAFTPNNSGLNEVFKPVMTGFDEQGYTMYIFNRWGNLIFETHDMQVGWDGTFHNDNMQVQDGVFTWKIEAKIKNSADSKIFVGHVSLLK